MQQNVNCFFFFYCKLSAPNAFNKWQMKTTVHCPSLLGSFTQKIRHWLHLSSSNSLDDSNIHWENKESIDNCYGGKLAKRLHLPCSNGLGMHRTKTKKHGWTRNNFTFLQHIWARKPNNDSTSGNNSKQALDREKVKDITSPTRPLTAYAKSLN